MLMLADVSEGVLALAAMTGGFIVVVVAIVYWAEVKVARQREESRREIAAYIAEGSITPEDGRRLLEAGGSLISRIRNAIGGRSK